jgi:hypothetical protein
MAKTRKARKGPNNSASEGQEGALKLGNDKRMWVIKKIGKSQRWVPYASSVIHGLKPLTIDILEKNIGKPVTVYERQSTPFWPKSLKDFDVKYTFTASGDGYLYTKKKNTEFKGWLKNKTYTIKPDEVFIVEGTMVSNDIESTLQVSHDGLVATNLMVSDAFVKA